MVNLKTVINRFRYRRHRRIINYISNPNSNSRRRRILNYISNPNSNSSSLEFGRNNTRFWLASTSSSRNETPSNRAYNDIDPNANGGLIRLNSSEDSADSTNIVPLSSNDSLQVTAYDNKKIVFSPLKSKKWFMDRVVRDGRKGLENSAQQLRFGLEEAAEEFGEQHKQGLKEAAVKMGEKHKEGMKKVAEKVGGKFVVGAITGASLLGFFGFLGISLNVHGTIFTIDVLCVSVLVVCIFWSSYVVCS